LTLKPEKGSVVSTVALGPFFSGRSPVLLAALTTGALLLAFSGDVAAKNPTPQQIKAAAEEFDRGVKAAQAGNFDEAASRFEAADREAPSPEALRAAIRARRDAKQGARAANLASSALLRYPSNNDLASFARGVLDQFSPGLHRFNITCKPECLLVVDNKLIPGDAASELALFLEPGTHTVSAGWDDKNQSREVTATAGGNSALAFAPPKDDKKTPPPPSASAASSAPAPEPAESAEAIPSGPKKGLSPAFTYIGIGLTVALGGASIWSGLDAQSNPGPDRVKERCVGLGESCPEYKDGLARQQRTNILLAATGGTAVVTGLVAALLTNWGDSPSSTARRAPRFLPGLSFEQGGATLQATGRF
jgi:hypothetical protein